MYFILILASLAAPAFGNPKSITSPNYLQAIKCFPDLRDEKLREKFSLDALRSQIDIIYPSMSENLVSRNIFFTNREGEKRILRIKPKGTLVFELVLESIDKKGVHSVLPLPERQKVKATQEDINQHLLNVEIVGDERIYDDTKLNNYKLGFKTEKGVVMELVFRRPEAKEKLYCYPKKKAGSVCVCK